MQATRRAAHFPPPSDPANLTLTVTNKRHNLGQGGETMCVIVKLIVAYFAYMVSGCNKSGRGAQIKFYEKSSKFMQAA